VLLIFIGAKMIAHSWLPIPHWISLVAIAGIIGLGVAASLLITERAPASPSP
jgi:predicted tellurium resistance membrane protein TerC